MTKPCRLELNNSGAWKLLGLFDAADDNVSDNVLTASASLAEALNAASGSDRAAVTLRVSTNETQPVVLMRWQSADLGWRDPVTGEPR